MRGLVRLIEGLYDENEHEPETGSFGWWIFPDGEIEEMSEMGEHGATAYYWLKSKIPDYTDEDYDEAITALKGLGGIRVATFHGADEMNIDFDPVKVSKQAKIAAMGLVSQTRGSFVRYWLHSGATSIRANRRQVMAALK